MYEARDDWAPLLFSSCVWVRGQARDTVCDLDRQRAVSLPGAFSSLMAHLHAHRGARLSRLIALLPDDQGPRLRGLVQFLLDQGLAFMTPFPERFPLLTPHASGPSTVSCALLDFDERSDHPMAPLIADLTAMSCEHLCVRLDVEDPAPRIAELRLALQGGVGMSVALWVRWAPWWQPADLEALIAALPWVVEVSVFSVPPGQQQAGVQIRGRPVDLHGGALHLDRCEAPTRGQLQLRREVLSTAQRSNVFTAHTVYVSARGHVKPTVGTAPVYGDVHTGVLPEIVGQPEYQAWWNLHKGMITGCKDCEWRLVCVDPRLPEPDGEGGWVHSQPCHYDPRKGEWRT